MAALVSGVSAMAASAAAQEPVQVEPGEWRITINAQAGGTKEPFTQTDVSCLRADSYQRDILAFLGMNDGHCTLERRALSDAGRTQNVTVSCSAGKDTMVAEVVMTAAASGQRVDANLAMTMDVAATGETEHATAAIVGEHIGPCLDDQAAPSS